MSDFQPLPGFRDAYPEELAKRNHIYKTWEQAARVFGFSQYDAPVLEPLDLYRRKSGNEIEEQLFNFIDKGEREVTLRPEMTPSVCRMVGACAGALKRPIKWFSIAECYRYERMQKGRSRCFSQFNADIFGEPGIEADIELIALLIQTLRNFGLSAKDFYIRLSDRKIWTYYLASLEFTTPQIELLLTDIDKVEGSGTDAFKNYEKTFGTLSKRSEILSFLQVKSLTQLESALGKDIPTDLVTRLNDWKNLLQGLNAMGLSDFVQVDLGVVRGLAYYTGFVFEAFDRQGDLRALAGGGRYDNLVEKLGGPDFPAVGFAIGDVTLALLLEARGLTRSFTTPLDVYCVLAGPKERLVALNNINALRAQGFSVEYPLKEIPFGKQFKLAAASGAKFALIYGVDECARNVVGLKNLQTRQEQEIQQTSVNTTITALLNNKASP